MLQLRCQFAVGKHMLKPRDACRFLLYNLLTLMYFTVSDLLIACHADVVRMLSILEHILVSRVTAMLLLEPSADQTLQMEPAGSFRFTS